MMVSITKMEPAFPLLMVVIRVLVTMVHQIVPQTSALTAFMVRTMFNMKLEMNGRMIVMIVIVMRLHTIVPQKRVEHLVFTLMEYLMILAKLLTKVMDVTTVLVQMALTPVILNLFVITMENFTALMISGRMDVMNVIVMIKENPFALMIVLVPPMLIVKQDGTVINPHVMIPLVLVSNALKITDV